MNITNEAQVNYSSGSYFYDSLRTDVRWEDLDTIAAADVAGEEILLDVWVSGDDGCIVDVCAAGRKGYFALLSDFTGEE